jgi:tetratricopeptide (TPR) repeat protein
MMTSQEAASNVPTVGPFTLIDVLGRGALAEVWRARHASGEELALKVLTHEESGEPAVVQAFRSEVRAVARLDHPNVIRLYEHGTVGRKEAAETPFRPGAPWLAMELCEGGTLSKRRGRLNWALLRKVLLQLLDALGHAHARGMVHRDIKPGNLLVQGGDLVLTDFGLAQALLEPSSSKRASAGTPAYMAPEQLRGEWRKFGPQADLYAVGCVAWTLVAGKPPFGTKMQYAVPGHIQSPVPPLPSEAPVPGDLQSWINSLMSKAPEDRPPSAAHAAAMLHELGDAEGSWRFGIQDPLSEGEQTVPEVELEPVDLKRWDPVPLPEDWREARKRPRRRLAGAGLGLFALRPPPFVGRAHHRDVLWEALGESIEGLARVVVLRGAAGTGKSRLAAWVCTRAHELGGLSVARALHGAHPGPRHGLAPLVRRTTRSMGLSGTELAQQVGDPVLASWLEGQARLQPRERNALVRRALGELAIIWLDDGQWGEDSLAWALESLLVGSPQLIVVTVQEEGLAERPRAQAMLAELLAHPGAQELRVGPLSDEESGELIRQMLSLHPKLVKRVQDRIGGNPLFAVELVGDWVQRSLLRPSPSGFILKEGARLELPDDLRSLWSSVVDRLCTGRPADDRLALELAATLGVQVDEEEWGEAIVHRKLSPSDELSELVRERNLARDQPQGWTFVHGMLRETLLLEARRRGRLEAHHAACADMLGEQLGFGVDERYALHLLASDRPEEALRPLLIGARELRATGDARGSARLLDLHDRALQQARIPLDDERRGDGRVERGALAMVGGDMDSERALHEGLLFEARAHGWRRHEGIALRELGSLEVKQGRAVEGLRQIEQALSIALALDDAGQAARCWWMQGLAAQGVGDLKGADELLGRAITFAHADSDGLCEAGASLARANVLVQLDQLSQAEQVARKAREIYARERVRHGEGGALNSLGEVARKRGQLAEAERFYRGARSNFAQAGSPDVHVAELNLALTLQDRGRHDQALALLIEASAGLEEAGWLYLLGGMAAFRLPSHAVLGDWQAFSADLSLAERLIESSGFAHEDCRIRLTEAAELAQRSGYRQLARRARDLAAEQERTLRG